MEKEFENRDIINRIFLKWNGKNFEENIAVHIYANEEDISNRKRQLHEVPSIFKVADFLGCEKNAI